MMHGDGMRKGAIVIASMTGMPLHQWQECHCINGRDAIASMAGVPLHQWQERHCVNDFFMFL
jgi:hypothetical protein